MSNRGLTRSFTSCNRANPAIVVNSRPSSGYYSVPAECAESFKLERSASPLVVMKMGVYVLLTKLTEKGRKVVKEKPERIEEVNKRVESLGVNILSQYALFGPYDFVNILKADNDEVVMKLVIDLTASGKMEILTLNAVHIDRFIERMTRASAK
jgi:uncharacterized protein with GYD domain